MKNEEEEIRFLVRVAGLPAEAVAAFHSESCRRQLELIDRFGEEILERRSALVALLESIIGGAPEAARHFWLALKRDCFNGRGLSRHKTHALWSTTPPEIQAGLAAIEARERERDEFLAEFEAIFAEEHRREARELIPYLDDTRFLRGVALSSGSLMEYLPRLREKRVEDYGRRENRLVSSLIRYLSRAAVKLSPFSSLTCVGLGRLVDPPQLADSPHLVIAAGWRERSVVRMQRYRVDQMVALLTRYPPFRRHLSVTLNETVEEIDQDGSFRYLKGPTWDLDPATGLLREAPYSIVTVRLRGPFIGWLRERLAGDDLPYGSLLATYLAVRGDPKAEDLPTTFDRLLEIGFLEFKRLSHTADPHPEKRLLEALETMPDEALSSLASDLETLLEGEETYSRSAEPVPLAQDLRRRIRAALSRAAPLAGFDPEITRKMDHRSLHEDVFLDSEESRPEIAMLSVGQYREIVDNLQIFARISNVRATQVEFLHSAVACAMEKWPGRTSAPFYDFFAAVNPLFSAFTKHDRGSLQAPPGEAVVFNPFDLESLRRLQEARQSLIAELPRCLVDTGEEALLDRAAVLELIERVPEAYRRPRDFCALVQPLNDQGSEWVLNLMGEGRGRLSSRFTATMNEAMRQAFAKPFVDASLYREDGREVELVDLYCSAGHSANVHVPMTRRVFQLPGNSSGLPPERLLRLSDLRVSWRDRNELPELVDLEGRKILPAHLGSVATVHMPRLVRLLALFGPSGFYFRRPTLLARDRDGILELKQHRIGNVVYRRQTWLVPPAPLAEALAGLREAAAYRYVNRWRLALGMPEQVYAHEAIVLGPSPYTKPQYVDFTSPQLVEIFCGILKAEVAQIQIVAALPTPEQQLRGHAGQRRAVEVHLESS